MTRIICEVTIDIDPMIGDDDPDESIETLSSRLSFELAQHAEDVLRRFKVEGSVLTTIGKDRK